MINISVYVHYKHSDICWEKTIVLKITIIYLRFPVFILSTKLESSKQGLLYEGVTQHSELSVWKTEVGDTMNR